GTITFTPEATTVANEAILTGTGRVTGANLSDRSVAGSDPDPDGDGNPSEAGATALTLPLAARIGVAKAVDGEPVVNRDGTVTVAYRLVVENLGNEVATHVQLTDDLATQLGPVTAVSFPSTDGLTPNRAFDGTNDINVLAGTDTLPVGAAASVVIEVTFRSRSGEVANSATGYATGEIDGVVVNDASAPGTDPDANGDGVPDEEGATTVDLGPRSGTASGTGGGAGGGVAAGGGGGFGRANPAGRLAFTGGALRSFVGWGGLLLLVGGGFVGATRRRRHPRAG
ncbi:MAG: hypothetical protein ACK5RL_13890, partial [Acidimicrobiales bacterium]